MTTIILPRDENDCSYFLFQELCDRIPDIIEEYPNFREKFFLHYWLNAGKFNVDKTETFIRETIQWRKLNNADVALKTELNHEIAECFQVYMDGRTRTGMLAWTANAGRFKFRDTINRFGKEQVLYYWLQRLMKGEKIAMDCTAEVMGSAPDGADVNNWPLIRKHWLILNLEGMDYRELLSKSSIGVFLALAKMAVHYFPTLDGTVVFINSGKFMEIFFKLLRPLLKGSNVDMIVCDSNEDKWKPLIHKYVDPCEIRPSFGGCKKE